MTIEEYIILNAPIKGVEPEDIEFLGFEASPSHVWSEWTSESFGAYMHYRIKTRPHLYNKYHPYSELLLGESEVCKFLNQLFPVKEVT